MVQLAIQPTSLEAREVANLDAIWTLEHAVVVDRETVAVEDILGQAVLALTAGTTSIELASCISIASLACAYARGEEVPPVAVSPIPRRRPTVRDGYHRILAAHAAGNSTLHTLILQVHKS